MASTLHNRCDFNNCVCRWWHHNAANPISTTPTGLLRQKFAITHCLLLTIAIIMRIPVAAAVNNCCIEPNEVNIEGECLNGTMLPDCDHQYMTINGTMYKYDDGNLTINEELEMSENRYCSTYLENTTQEVHIMCWDKDGILEKEQNDIVVNSLTGISIICLCFTLYIYARLYKALLDVEGVTSFHTMLGITSVNICTMVAQCIPKQLVNYVPCLLYAYVFYFFFIYSCVWLNTCSFNVWKSSVKPKMFSSDKKCLIYYHAYGFGLPLTLIAILVIAQHSPLPLFDGFRPGIGERTCWFNSTETIMLYLIAPTFAMLGSNPVFYILVLRTTFRQIPQSNERFREEIRNSVKLCVRMFYIIGLSWSLELLGQLFRTEDSPFIVIWYLGDLVIASQGIIISSILVWTRKKVLAAMAQYKLCWIPWPDNWRILQNDTEP